MKEYTLEDAIRLIEKEEPHMPAKEKIDVAKKITIVMQSLYKTFIAKEAANATD